jgi:hypothetical protein
MDLLSDVLILQESHKDLLDPQPYFSRLFTRPLAQSLGREPKYIEIYPDDLWKWICPFFAFEINLQKIGQRLDDFGAVFDPDSTEHE